VYVEYDVCVVGGCGHVGLPLAISFADRGLRVSIHDINDRAIALVREGRMPFRERGAEPALRRVIGRTLEAANDSSLVSRSRIVVVVIGTPVDEHLNPTFHSLRRFFLKLLPHLVDGQCLVLRSTVCPGTTDKIDALIRRSGKDVKVAFCPERVAEGRAMEELADLPQIVSGCDELAVEMAEELFLHVARKTIRMSPTEAELVKIFTNAWRYIQFATANQFFMVASDFGLDFHRIHDALTRDYPRMAGIPTSGFAAGPCLFKDTMQLAAVAKDRFYLGHAAMLVNEGLPNYLVQSLKKRYPLDEMRVGILGMAFKSDSDDPRESLSYKLRKILEYEAAEVLCTDVYIEERGFLPLDEVLRRSDLLILATPHQEYRRLALPEETLVVDIWNTFGRGVFPSSPAAPLFGPTTDGPSGMVPRLDRSPCLVGSSLAACVSGLSLDGEELR
jgi:UDP-N-acetyl-D-mannosaminuronic acid dehydrogenase